MSSNIVQLRTKHACLGVVPKPTDQVAQEGGGGPGPHSSGSAIRQRRRLRFASSAFSIGNVRALTFGGSTTALRGRASGSVQFRIAIRPRRRLTDHAAHLTTVPVTPVVPPSAVFATGRIAVVFVCSDDLRLPPRVPNLRPK